MVEIIFRKDGENERTIDAAIGASIMETARDNNVAGIVAECGGACACATCHVYIDEAFLGRIPEIGDMERDMLEFASGIDSKKSRLSCQIQVSAELDGLVVQIPESQG